MYRFIGIDPGVTGAMAILTLPEKPGEKAECSITSIETPFIGKHEVWKPPLIEMYVEVLRSEIDTFGRENLVITVEKVHGMPGDSVVSVFRLGVCFGQIISLLTLLDLDYMYATPKVWKHYYMLDSDKQKSIDLALRLFPDADLRSPYRRTKAPDHNRAEALLIALYGAEKFDGRGDRYYGVGRK